MSLRGTSPQATNKTHRRQGGALTEPTSTLIRRSRRTKKNMRQNTAVTEVQKMTSAFDLAVTLSR
jgi:hypothetical protein